jgi:hypothetical protein
VEKGEARATAINGNSSKNSRCWGMMPKAMSNQQLKLMPHFFVSSLVFTGARREGAAG